MKKLALLFLLYACLSVAHSQQAPALFASIEPQFPNLPKGLCAAVSYQQSRWQPLHDSFSCSGRPLPHGILGWILEPGTVYRNHLQRVADLSGMGLSAILESPQSEVFAWHKALDSLRALNPPAQAEDWLWLAFELAEIPLPNGSSTDWAGYYWLEELASIWSHLGGPSASVQRFRPADPFTPLERSGLDGIATYNPSPACNFSSRNGASATAVAIHTTQGSFAGALAWFMSCQSQVSCHYLIRSSDGMLLQLVNEDLKAWHVGTENAYSIGIEHEGFVSNPAWYTDTMYRVSARLVQRIAGRHSLNVGRTAWWPWAATTNYAQAQRPGSCTRIKGHQHFPNQTHTDPGQHWNWPRYADLLQPGLAMETVLGPSGSLVFPQQPPYANDSLKQWRIRVPSGRVKLQFAAQDLESTWDYLRVYDGPGTDFPYLAQLTGNQVAAPLLSSGNEVVLRFQSDCAISGQGFSLSWEGVSGAGEDSIPPSTQIDSLGSPWISQDFLQGFTDVDSGGSGLHSTYWNALHHDGQGFYGRSPLGMFADFFDPNLTGLHPQWTVVSGQWQQGTGQLYPLNPNQISGVSAAVPQGSSGERYWAFDFVVYPNGPHPFASLFLAADQAAGPGRNNSLEWRIEMNGNLPVYVWNQGQPQLLAGISAAVQPGQLQRVLVCRRGSTYRFYLNQQYLGELLAPQWNQNSAQFISMETKDAIVAFDAVHSGPGRPHNTAAWVTTGLFPIGHLPNPNPNPTQAGGRILSLANDGAGNVSFWQVQDLNVDFTPPYASSWINDGLAADKDTLLGMGWSMNWAGSADPHSGLSTYETCLGSVWGQCDILPWQAVGLSPFWTSVPGGLNLGQTYYSGVRAMNGAGMLGAPVFSDGALWLGSVGQVASFSGDWGCLGPNPFLSELNLRFGGLTESLPVLLLDACGKTVWQGRLPQSGELRIEGLSGLAEGIYLLSLPGLKGIKVVKTGL